MSIMQTSAFSETPREIVEYATTHTQIGHTISVLRMHDGEGYHFIATGEDSDFEQLRAMGYETVEIYAPDQHPILDNSERYAHSDDRCC